jgi:NAD(P)H-dependent FMN reductase
MNKLYILINLNEGSLMKKTFFYILFAAFISTTQMQAINNPSEKTILIILGSTRLERSSEKIVRALQASLTPKSNFIVKVADLRDFQLPFLADAVAPASRKEITDPQVKKWSDKILQADAFIFVVPEYNGGYPGVLKNALDSLYKEWNNKPVGFVGYSGGPSGGKSAIAQLKSVAQALQMVPVECDIFIPTSWKALTKQGKLENKNIEQEFAQLVNQIIAYLNKK